MPGPLPQVATGWSFSCLLARDGRVFCWGDNALGQLGASGRGKSEGCIGEAYEEEVEFPGRCDAEPRVVAGLDQVRELAVGHSHACALRRDGSVWCWGKNWQGQLGAGNDPRVTAACRDDVACARTPLPVPGIRARSIAAGGASSCAVLESGQVACWGDAAFGQVSKTNERCTASRLACARTPVIIDGVTDVSHVAVGGRHVCALQKDGRVLCWGGNDDGQTGVPRGSSERCYHDSLCIRQPTVVRGVRARQVVAGGFHTCALQDDGHVKCWGRDDGGQLGAGTADETCSIWIINKGYPCTSTPRSVQGLERVTRLAAGGTCAIDGDGRLLCWGSDVYGQLGVGGAAGRCRINGDFELPCSRAAVTVADADLVTAAASSGGHVCSLARDDRLLCWGTNDVAQAGPPAKPIDLCVHIPPDQKTPCLRRPRQLSVVGR
jgi:alpha-tubulin suppressor-like RCC1 family protein